MGRERGNGMGWDGMGWEMASRARGSRGQGQGGMEGITEESSVINNDTRIGANTSMTTGEPGLMAWLWE